MSEIEIDVRMVGRDLSEKHSLHQGARIMDLLDKVDRNPETLVVKRNGKMVPEEEKLEEGDRIEIIPVVSGGLG